MIGKVGFNSRGTRPPDRYKWRPTRRYSTVTDLARFLGWSTSVPFSTAT